MKCEDSLPALAAITLEATSTGVRLAVVVPLPNWPLALFPIAYRLPEVVRSNV